MVENERHENGASDAVTVHDTPESIAMYKLWVTIQYADGRARGMHLVDPRKARGAQLKNLRTMYGISARRWDKAEAELRALMADWKENGVPEKFCVRR